MKVIAFGASYSRTSINKQLAAFAAHQFTDASVEVLDLNNYQLPLFTVDVEQEIGHPQAAKDFVAKMEEADLLIISMGEHNGMFQAAFKNLFDWSSRVKLHLFENKRMLLLSTSPGSRGGQSALAAAVERFPRHGATILATFSLPNFGQNFLPGKGIINDELSAELLEAIQKTKTADV